VQATIGGVDATVLFAGAAPGFIASVLQVNAVVPVTIQPGANTEILLNVAGVTSHPDVTIAVE
jgi:uncharacterized protein (TIGR03437 family)